jgi:hypothetical protein
MDRTVSRRLILTFVISLVVYAIACFSPVAWSPDNRWLAFTAVKQKDVKGSDGKSNRADFCQLWLWAMPDGPGKKLAEGGVLSAPVFTQDGKRLLFVEYDLAPAPPEKQDPLVKRSGRLVSMEVETGQRSVVAELPPVTGAPNHENASRFAPSISPDGKKVVLTVEEGGDPSVYLAECDTGKTRLLLRYAGYPRWSPDGSRICYVHQLPGFKDKMDAYSVEVMQVESGKRASLGPLYFCSHEDICESWLNVSWRPDSKRVAYTSCIRPGLDKNGQEALYIADLDGTRTEFLRGDKERTLTNPVWSADGTRVAIAALIRGSSEDETGTALMLLDYPSKKLSVVAQAMPVDPKGVVAYTMPSWSPDGRWIAMRLQGIAPVLVPVDGTAKKYLVYDDESAVFAALYQLASLKALELCKQFTEARQEAVKVLQFIDAHAAEFVQFRAEGFGSSPGTGKKDIVAGLKLYPLYVLNRFEEVERLGKEKIGPGKDYEAYVQKAQLALGHYDQVKDADKTVKQAKDTEKEALGAKEPAESARLWLEAGDLWYERLMNKALALQAYENAVKALPESPEAKMAQEKIAEVKDRFGDEGTK